MHGKKIPRQTLYQDRNNLDEFELLKRIGQGNMAAFEGFYKRYYHRLFHFILQMTHNPESAEEVIHDTLMVVWEKPDHFNHESKICTWVYGIAYHKAMKSICKNARHSNHVDVDDLAETLDDNSVNQSQIYEDQDWLKCALDSLPAEQRAVIELTFFYEMSYQDIARVLDCPENTVKTRMFHARKKLRFVQKIMDSQISTEINTPEINPSSAQRLL